jgi:hypothetical protein
MKHFSNLSEEKFYPSDEKGLNQQQQYFDAMSLLTRKRCFVFCYNYFDKIKISANQAFSGKF